MSQYSFQFVECTDKINHHAGVVEIVGQVQSGYEQHARGTTQARGEQLGGLLDGGLLIHNSKFLEGYDVEIERTASHQDSIGQDVITC